MARTASSPSPLRARPPVAEVRAYRAYGATLLSDLPLPELAGPAARAARPDCVVSVGPAPAEPARWFPRWRHNGAVHLLTARTGSGYLLRFPGLADFEVSSGGEWIRYRGRPPVPRVTLRHLLLDQVVPLALARAGRLVLHASAVHLPGFGAVAFAGPAGVGKSTLAAALNRQGCALLSDDALVVGDRRGSLWSSPAYPGLRLWDDAVLALGGAGRLTKPVAHYTSKTRVSGSRVPFRDRPSRLKAVFVLLPRRRGGTTVRAREMPGGSGLMTLVRHAYLLDVTDRGELARVFEHLAHLAALAPVRGLRLPDDPRRIGQAAAEVLALARRGA